MRAQGRNCRNFTDTPRKNKPASSGLGDALTLAEKDESLTCAQAIGPEVANNKGTNKGLQH